MKQKCNIKITLFTFWQRCRSKTTGEQTEEDYEAISQGTLVEVLLQQRVVWNSMIEMIKREAFVLFAYRMASFGLWLLFYVNWFYWKKGIMCALKFQLKYWIVNYAGAQKGVKLFVKKWLENLHCWLIFNFALFKLPNIISAMKNSVKSVFQTIELSILTMELWNLALDTQP